MKRVITILLAALLCAVAVQAQEYVPTPVTVSKEKVKLNGKVYLSHVVLERQTLYGISKAYGVTEEDLYEANPSLRETGLQKNAIILVPYREPAAVQPAVQEDKSYTEHTVKWYEDIEDIARKYNISVKELMEYNGLKNRKLASRQVLRIPVNHVAYSEEPAKEEMADQVGHDGDQAGNDDVIPDSDRESPVTEEIAGQAGSDVLSFTPKQDVEFSLVLPLRASGNVSELNMDFYSGVLMAVKDLEAEGLKIKMNVFDLMAGMPALETLTRGDFVLGPIASRDMEAVLQMVDGKVQVISPLDQKTGALAQNYTSFVQAPTSIETQWEDLASWVAEDLDDDDRVLFVTEKGASSVSASVAIRSALARKDVPYQILSYAIVEGTSIPATMEEMLTKDGENRIVVASESEAFVGDVVRNIGIMMGKGFDVVMYAPSKVRTFETIEGTDYHAARLHISSSYFVDYSNPKVDAFVKAYRALFKTEPSQFAFQGYDTARYFMERCTKGVREAHGLHTDFSLQFDLNGNAANKAVRRIVYNKDFSTSIER
ncbi:MAG: LysM peptidoglycan-binding domain-containing protein [Bacteroidales bacterium]|nr:LysM peptidoglycan-binding domain-containing protein [Bacteroidales bacterium]